MTTQTTEPVAKVIQQPLPDECHLFECRGFVYADEDGGFCAYATRLPGVYGEGETVEEAFSDLCDAFQMALEIYREEGKQIPWRDRQVDEGRHGAELWAVVNVKKTPVG